MIVLQLMCGLEKADGEIFFSLSPHTKTGEGDH